MSIKSLPVKIKMSYVGRAGDAAHPQSIHPSPYMLPTTDNVSGKLEKPVSRCMPIARPLTDFPLATDQTQSNQMGKNPPPCLDMARATFVMELHNHYNHYARIQPNAHIGIRKLMPDIIYQHLICSLQDDSYLSTIKQSDEHLWKLLDNFQRNNRLQLFYSVVPAPDDSSTTTIMPVQYAYVRKEQRSQPDRPIEGEQSTPTGLRVIPISQIPSILKHCFEARLHRGGRSTAEYVHANYTCIPHSLVLKYRKYDPLCAKSSKTSRNSKPQLKPVIASKPRERYTIDLVDK